MKTRYIVLIVFLNFIFQTTILTELRIYGIVPNTALILVVCASLLMGMKKGLVVAVTAGLLQDLNLSIAVGIHVLIYCVVAAGIGLLEGKLFKDNTLTPTVLMMVATLIYYGIYYTVVFFGREAVSIQYVMIQKFPKEVLFNIVVCLLLYRFSFNRVRVQGMR